MSELRSEGVAQSSPPYIPAKDHTAKARFLPVRHNGHPAVPPARQSPHKKPGSALPSLPAAAELLAATIRLADDIAESPNHGETALPRENLRRLAELGLLLAPLPTTYGGLGLGSEPAGHLTLLRMLAAIGGADLVLARLYEGHVNAIIFIAAYGSPQQIASAAQDCCEGRWFGVWNTGPKDPLLLHPGPTPGTFVLNGAKNFASGADIVQRPIVTAQRGDGTWQMTLPRMESPEVARHLEVDRSFWNPLGMQASGSYAVDFTGACLTREDLIGSPEDIYRDPLFFGGTIRFAAAQAGAVLRLHRLFADWLARSTRAGDPYQIARLGEIALGAQEAVLWIERAAAVAAECLSPHADKHAIERMHETADMTRLAIERIATAMMPRVVAGIGAHGLLQPYRFERILRDLTMYLRQPLPDHCLAALGRASLRKSSLRPSGANHAFWSEPISARSLPPFYFQQLYERSRDPWNFETSPYEAAKYRQTLASLPNDRYRNALEVGCSIGVLTAQLASRCDALLSLDVSEAALATARECCASLANVRFERMEVPREEPNGLFDLVVVSEVAYYWQREDLDRAIAMLATHQLPGAHLLLVHHTPVVPDYPLTGNQVHDIWLARPDWRVLKQERHEGYRLDLLERVA